ncbi:Ribosomal protein L11 methyltransferase (PrmA) [Streptoalloteichus tenebrarius]|uniref:Ribosomal protein L11 methyltransferase (PrmA) n=1 Tax=Streptoalloteichus tenebrarius (strain ATCC 17920 / DSM 40477 / JCM 4838 / CBS 697.72 / NBRC 16177 / NCIMB 11028 / NRRL B-12390 / A12253. 1 / ISP 5477) TaxID=1933 RepID=A0ABT1I178_STRSD|nr:class I SAM-dependent methyltransferase [Streptoalloteichus tenebrarius]MCP2261488.1 Ribosomal protein L11 methyltransferase (PrmA) [Streptoalloteichus tenebrarius]BFE99355.1 class I SAM-dependent methyltransferase [Streptoalloteichus tenebrarius]
MPEIRWIEDGVERRARWRSETGLPLPRRVVVADDRMPADTAYRLACEGTALLWRGDFPNARQLLRAMARRVDRRPPRPGATPTETFHRVRQARGRRARVLGMLLVALEDDHSVALRRAPDVRRACLDAYGPPDGPSVTSLRELLGVIGAREWRGRGVVVPALGDRIHPHYGVFSPTRGEYLDLVAEAPLPLVSPLWTDESTREPYTAFDVGTGTGVLAAILARRGIDRVVATDTNPRAVACARENMARLGLADRVEVVSSDLFPPGRAAVAVCNPPWLPATPTSTLEHGVYDPGSRMLLGFLDGLADHLAPGGEGWLILSDLAERLGLRDGEELPEAIRRAGLRVVGRTDARPRHGRAADPRDPLHFARSAEVTTLWRLAPATPPPLP